jgi:hypothetical protein
MKVLSLKTATVLLEGGKYKLVWNTVSAKYLLHFIGKYNEKKGLDSTYTVQYKTGNKLDTKFGSENK